MLLNILFLFVCQKQLEQLGFIRYHNCFVITFEHSILNCLLEMIFQIAHQCKMSLNVNYFYYIKASLPNPIEA
jgi:hypothetical protein